MQSTNRIKPVGDGNRVGRRVFHLILFLIFLAISALCISQVQRLKAVEAELAEVHRGIYTILERQEQSIQILSRNDGILETSLRDVKDKLLRVEKAVHARIEYYRDVLQIVAKTCPGRMWLPRLEGDPGGVRLD